jgi:Ca2+-binding RTX toxin-like protein
MPSKLASRALLTTAALLLLGVTPASAGTVRATGPDEQCEEQVSDPICTTSLRVTHAAEPGERNDLTVERVRGFVVVRDAGAPVTAGKGCAQVAPGEARCADFTDRPGGGRIELTVTAEAGDGDDRLAVGALPGLTTVELSGGAGDDLITGATGPDTRGDAVVLGGGDGADRLLGGAGPEQLDGGKGQDELRGGGGDDRLSGEAIGFYDEGVKLETVPDVLDGGPGRDEANYSTYDVPVTVDLADPAPDGAAGEADVLSGIEDVTGGRGAATLLGDDGPNRLAALSDKHPQRLEGRGGDDVLEGAMQARDVSDGGAGDDTIDSGPGSVCGAGNDTLSSLGDRTVPAGLRAGRPRVGPARALPAGARHPPRRHVRRAQRPHGRRGGQAAPAHRRRAHHRAVQAARRPAHPHHVPPAPAAAPRAGERAAAPRLRLVLRRRRRARPAVQDPLSSSSS